MEGVPLGLLLTPTNPHQCARTITATQSSSSWVAIQACVQLVCFIRPQKTVPRLSLQLQRPAVYGTKTMGWTVAQLRHRSTLKQRTAAASPLPSSMTTLAMFPRKRAQRGRMLTQLQHDLWLQPTAHPKGRHSLGCLQAGQQCLPASAGNAMGTLHEAARTVGQGPTARLMPLQRLGLITSQTLCWLR